MPTLIRDDLEFAKNAPVRPEDSASGIVRPVARERDPSEHVFVDCEGNKLPWQMDRGFASRACSHRCGALRSVG